MREQHSHHSLSIDVSRRIDRLSLRDHPISLQEDFSSDEGESVISQACLIFEYLERDPPYGREPLADKVRNSGHLFFFFLKKTTIFTPLYILPPV